MCQSNSGDVSLMTWRRSDCPTSSAESFPAWPFDPVFVPSHSSPHPLCHPLCRLRPCPFRPGWQRLIDQLVELSISEYFQSCCHVRQNASTESLNPGSLSRLQMRVWSATTADWPHVSIWPLLNVLLSFSRKLCECEFTWKSLQFSSVLRY